ncbi:sporulation histidine kinase inhibitor Sda [Paenibacillaceae bacterium]|nr:sporulation histidine kinase inhibitor Sda [Paenibacillaceae bacterium]
MEILSDEMLLDTYTCAVKLKLEAEFIGLLLTEIKRRGIHPDTARIGA